MTEPGAASDEWTVILPVKTLSTAKSRMSAAGGGPSASLAMAFFQDTLTAVSDCLLVSRAIIATADRVIGGLASAQGCLVVDDTGHPGINQAARWAATAAEPASRIAILVSDLPCLTAESLQAVLTCARVHERSFLADAAGTGTTMWFAGAGAPLESCFGRSSRQAHRAAGHADLVDLHASVAPGFQRARRDVDTESDLVAAAAIGLGSFTVAALAAMPRR